MHKLNESVFLGVLSVCKTQKAYLPLHHWKMTMLLWEWLIFFFFFFLLTDLTGPLRLNTKRNSTVSRRSIQSCPRPQKYWIQTWHDKNVRLRMYPPLQRHLLYDFFCFSWLFFFLNWTFFEYKFSWVSRELWTDIRIS